MTVESWITPEETPALAEAAAEVIEARLSRLSEPERAAYWASIRKAYNTPYNEPVRQGRPARGSAVEEALARASLVEGLPPTEIDATGPIGIAVEATPDVPSAAVLAAVAGPTKVQAA